MGRSRSRSPRRERRRHSRSRDPEKEREKRRHRRSKSRSPKAGRKSPNHYRSRRRSRSRSRSRSQSNDDVVYTGTTHISDPQTEPKNKHTSAQNGDGSIENSDDAEMMKLMGFAKFDSTKGQKVDGSNNSAANIVQKRKYRQYMNRRGGFNRPLDFVA